MGRINVQGLGVVEIEGETPTAQESEEIGRALQTLINDQVGDSVADKVATEYSDSPNFGRIVTEVAGSIVGSIAAGGFTLPGIARNVGMRSLPFLKALAKASAGSAESASQCHRCGRKRGTGRARDPLRRRQGHPGGHGQRRRHRTGRSAADLRSVLHDQATWPRHGARPGHRPSVAAPPPRRHHGGVPPRPHRVPGEPRRGSPDDRRQ